MLRVVPLTLAQANDAVTRLHRHHQPVTGHRFSIGAADEHGQLHGAAIVGRPVARAVDQHTTAEVTRLVTDGTPNACSLLYGACARAARAMGFDTIQTYTLASEPGTSLRAAGWVLDGHVRGRSWSTPGRPRTDTHPTEDKHRWVRRLT
ncbi:XF1762 family protein [Catellatospora sp. NPDC049609]|uniref:XF1762 family protein n=1 Tax=Catellatospora sp. NPDC049609 TaxID=3155505 RepID=UPI00341F61AA